MSARGSSARMSWLPATHLPAAERSFNQWPSTGASVQPAPPTPWAGRQGEVLGGARSPAWAQPFPFFFSFFLSSAVQGFQLLTLIYAFYPFNIC